MLTRREFIVSMGGAGALLACGEEGPSTRLIELATGGGSARLDARPGAPTIAIAPGTYPITATPRDGSLVVPTTYRASKPMPMVLALHGAGGTAAGPISLLSDLAESSGFCVLAVSSRGATWDGISGQFGRDVAFIDAALTWAFARCAVDAARMVVEGFSDGASYALSLAQANGDLFPRAVAFSPGFVPAFSSGLVGKPEFFVSHGRQDPILNIDQASRRIVPSLKAQGYQVFYTEFDGGHSVPTDIVRGAAQFIMA